MGRQAAMLMLRAGGKSRVREAEVEEGATGEVRDVVKGRVGVTGGIGGEEGAVTVADG
jgi:hypothetical protein